MKSSVVLINSFSVPKGMEEEFVKKWNDTAQYLKNEPGFIDTKLHRSLTQDAEFQFVNVAHWESPEAWKNALSKHVTEEKELPIEPHFALYRVEVQY